MFRSGIVHGILDGVVVVLCYLKLKEFLRDLKIAIDTYNRFIRAFSVTIICALRIKKIFIFLKEKGGVILEVASFQAKPFSMYFLRLRHL